MDASEGLIMGNSIGLPYRPVPPPRSKIFSG